MLLELCFIIGALFLYLKYQSLFKGYEKLPEMFPSLPAIPIFGSAIAFLGDSADIYRVVMKYSNLYQRSFYAYIGPRVLLGVVKPREIEAVLNNNSNLTKGAIYNSLLPWIGRGLLTSKGDQWRKHRKLLTPAFHFNILNNFLEVFNKNTASFCKNLSLEVGKKDFDVMSIVKLYALDNICETSMGVPIRAQDDPQSEYVTAIKTMCVITVNRNLKPWLTPDITFNLTPYAKQQKKALEHLHGFTKKVINMRIIARQANEGNLSSSADDVGIKKRNAFLDLLLDCMDEGEITLNDVQQEVDTFMFEGHDTITSGMSHILYTLAHNSKHQELVYQELKEIFGTDDRYVTNEDLNNMKYTEMVIKECMRLHPPVPGFSRTVETDLKIDEETIIPKGTELVILPAAVHRNKDIWEKPNEFYPEHFTLENSAKRHPYAYIPFSAGSRNCIGLKFAMMEMKVTLAKVLRKFEFRPADPVVPLDPAMEIVLMSKSGLHVSVVKRNI